MKEIKTSLKEKLIQAANGMERPMELMTGMPRVELIGNRYVIIENHKGILEYDEKEMRINGGKLIIKVVGSNLAIQSLNSNELSISGDVIMIEYLI